MSPTHTEPVAPLPEIVLTSDEHARLSRLIGEAWAAEGVAGLLQQELERATLCDPVERPANAVGLDRWVHYTDGRAPTSRRIRIVMPKDADIDAGCVSALSHVGSGLLGLLEGDSILWPDPSGGTRRLTPILVEDPDEMI